MALQSNWRCLFLSLPPSLSVVSDGPLFLSPLYQSLSLSLHAWLLGLPDINSGEEFEGSEIERERARKRDWKIDSRRERGRKRARERVREAIIYGPTSSFSRPTHHSPKLSFSLIILSPLLLHLFGLKNWVVYYFNFVWVRDPLLAIARLQYP